jgi:hypothetical protein
VRARAPAAALAALGALLWLGACGPRVAVREPVGAPIDPAGLDRLLREYNAAPAAVRLQGRLWAEGRGSADFGARAHRGEGLRLDAVAGPFSTPVLSLACRQGEGGACQVYLPTRRTAYREEWGAWGPWFETLLLGRVPRVGSPAEAWIYPDGRRVLVLEGIDGWRQEVAFAADTGLPHRVFLSQEGEPRLELAYGRYTDVDGHPFPGRVSVRAGGEEGGYQLEFQRIVPDASLADGTLTLTLPPGTAVKGSEGMSQWNQAPFPMWRLPRPDG